MEDLLNPTDMPSVEEGVYGWLIDVWMDGIWRLLIFIA